MKKKEKSNTDISTETSAKKEKKCFNKKKLLIGIALTLVIACILDIVACTVLYFVEPVAYNEPILAYSNFIFDAYKQYSYEKDPEFYIKQVTANDVVAHPDEKMYKYINETVVMIAEDDASKEDIEQLIADSNGDLCGYIADINMFQAEFDGADYDKLCEISNTLTDSDLVNYATIDYFDEFEADYPTDLIEERYKQSQDDVNVSDTIKDNTSAQSQNNEKYFELINYPDDISKYEQAFDEIRVGIYDIYVDPNNYLDVINTDKYDAALLRNDCNWADLSHGSHIAGIFAASKDSFAPAICPGADIVSCNGVCTALSFWASSFTDMVVNYQVKSINVSLGWLMPYGYGAQLGCEFATEIYNKNADFFEAFLKELVNTGNEFIICCAAGNESGTPVNKTSDGSFRYATLNILNKVDLFNIFTKKPEYADALYFSVFGAIDDQDVKDRIIVVGACNTEGHMTDFSCAGKRVDILAPGDDVQSFILDGNYIAQTGTSMASPYVAGTAAMLFAVNEDLTAKEVKEIIISAATEETELYGFSYPILNVGNAVEMAEKAKQSPI